MQQFILKSHIQNSAVLPGWVGGMSGWGTGRRENYTVQYIHTFHRFISVSYRQQDVEEVINTQDIQIYSAKYYKHFTKAVLLIIFTNKKSIYRVSGVCM